MKITHILNLSLTFLLSIFSKFANGQNPDLKNFNGWQFLKWSLTKIETGDILHKKKIEFDPGSPNQKSGPTTKFVHINMKTTLFYKENLLSDVQQYQYFKVGEKSKADQAFTKLKKLLIKEYGKPKVQKFDKNEGKLHISWELKFTLVNLYFSGSDEMPAGFESSAYEIFLQSTPSKESGI